MSKQKRSRCWCFTSFRDGVRDPECAEYYVAGREVCPDTGRKHFQGYVRFKHAKSLSAAKALLGDPAAHLEGRRGTEREAADYCKKDGDYVERGEVRDDESGRRTDLEVVRSVLNGGEGTVGAVIDAGISYQGIRYAEKWLVYKEPLRDPSKDPPVVRWYWGATGTGKSRAAHAEATESGERVYRAIGPSARGGRWWWDGYDGHKYVIIDDFRPSWCGLSFMLNLLDRFGMRVECKGGSRSFRATSIWITCPKHPESCYVESGEDVEQLVRRVTEIKEFV